MRTILAAIDLANLLLFLGALSGSLTVYWLAPLWTPAYIGLVFVVAGAMIDLGRKTTNGPPR